MYHYQGAIALFCMTAYFAGYAQAQSLSASPPGPGATLLNTSRYVYGPGDTLFAYPTGFPLITCNGTAANPTQTLNVSFTNTTQVPILTASASSPNQALRALVREPWPNNVTGLSVGTDQSVFAITDDLFFEPYFGIAWVLNGTQYVTFDESLSGVTARNPYTQSVQTLQHILPEYPYLSGYHYTALYPARRTANQTDGTSNGTVYLTVATDQAWTKAVERLLYYTELVTMQASTTTPCSTNSSGWYQLTPVLNHLLFSVLAANTSYSLQSLTLLDNVTLPNIIGLTPSFYTTNLTGFNHYTDLVSTASFLPVDATLRTFTTPSDNSATNVIQCLTACREYQQGVAGIPPCNVWNWCNSMAGCTFALNTTQNSIPLHTCLLGYSSAAAQNLPVAGVNLRNTGYWSGRNTAIKPFNTTGPFADSIVTTTNITYVAAASPTT